MKKTILSLSLCFLLENSGMSTDGPSDSQIAEEGAVVSTLNTDASDE